MAPCLLVTKSSPPPRGGLRKIPLWTQLGKNPPVEELTPVIYPFFFPLSTLGLVSHVSNKEKVTFWLSGSRKLFYPTVCGILVDQSSYSTEMYCNLLHYQRSRRCSGDHANVVSQRIPRNCAVAPKRNPCYYETGRSQDSIVGIDVVRSFHVGTTRIGDLSTHAVDKSTHAGADRTIHIDNLSRHRPRSTV